MPEETPVPWVKRYSRTIGGEPRYNVFGPEEHRFIAGDVPPGDLPAVLFAGEMLDLLEWIDRGEARLTTEHWQAIHDLLGKIRAVEEEPF